MAHQMEVASTSNPIRLDAPRALRQATVPSATLHAIQSTGPRPTRSSEVALTPPIVRVTRAKSAGCRHPGVRSARTVRASIHGSPAHGSRITEMRAM